MSIEICIVNSRLGSNLS